jgi:hypothetical protein
MRCDGLLTASAFFCRLRVECANSKECSPAKHHFDECVERVTQNSENPDFKGPHEDCVEECEFLFFPSLVFPHHL